MALTDSTYQSLTVAQIAKKAADGATFSTAAVVALPPGSGQDAWRVTAGLYAKAGNSDTWGDLKIADQSADAAWTLTPNLNATRAASGAVHDAAPPVPPPGAAPAPAIAASVTRTGISKAWAWFRSKLPWVLVVPVAIVLLVVGVATFAGGKKGK